MSFFTVLSTHDEGLINYPSALFESIKRLGDGITSETISVVASYDSSYAIVEQIFAMFPCRYINEEHGQMRSVKKEDFERFNYYLIEMAQEITKDLAQLANSFEKKKEFDIILNFISIFDFAAKNDLAHLLFLTKSAETKKELT